MSTPVFLITLRDEPWKGEFARAHCESRGINPVVVWGLSGYSLALRAGNPYGFDSHGVPEYIHATQVGCALAHISALNCAVTSGHPEFIVCEDDVDLPANFQANWQKIRKEIPDDIDVVQLEHMHSDKCPGAPISKNLANSFYPFGAACIWWRRSAAEKAINMIPPIDSPFDIILMRRVFPFLNHAITTPALVTQRSADGRWPSSVGGKLK